MQQVNDGFYFQMDLNGESRLRNFFGPMHKVGHLMKILGTLLHLTHLTNKYEMLFAPFVVNQFYLGQDYYQVRIQKLLYDCLKHG